ncbi:hypothetical protein D3C84_1206290 [compost metagenome]
MRTAWAWNRSVAPVLGGNVPMFHVKPAVLSPLTVPCEMNRGLAAATYSMMPVFGATRSTICTPVAVKADWFVTWSS